MPRKKPSKSSKSSNAAPQPQASEGAPLIGVDLGTTNSAVAYVTADGKPAVIPNELGENVTPSAVYYDKDKVVVGRTAQNMSFKEPSRFAELFKPEMGARDDDGAPLTLRFDSDSGAAQTAVTHSAHVLAALKAQVERRLGVAAGHAVITVPAYFEDRQREDVMLAGSLAGFESVRLLEEPVAAAMAYGMEKQGQDMNLLVYDLGGGTFDCTVVSIQGGALRVLAKSGDARLGADDFRMKIMEAALRAFEGEHGFAFDPAAYAEDFHELRLRSEACLKDLSLQETATLRCSCSGYSTVVQFDRGDLESMILPFVEATHEHVRKALQAAGLRPLDVDAALLVGGGTRVPLVRRRLEELMGQAPRVDVDPDAAVALGAAVYAHEWSQQEGAPADIRKSGLLLPPAPFQTHCISSFPLSVVVINGGSMQRESHEMIPSGAALPARQTERFSPVEDNQAGVSIVVTQQAQGTPFLQEHAAAQFQLEIEPMLLSRGGNRIEVRYAVDEDGLVDVYAKDHASGNEVSGKAQIKHELRRERVEAERKAYQRDSRPAA